MLLNATQLIVRVGPIALTTTGASVAAVSAATVILAVGGAVALILVGWHLGYRLADPAPVALTLPVALRRDGTRDSAEG